MLGATGSTRRQSEVLEYLVEENRVLKEPLKGRALRLNKQLTFRGFEAITVEALRELRAEKDAEMEALYARIAKLEAALDQVRLSR